MKKGLSPKGKNIDPIVDTVKGIAKMLNTVTSTPLRPALYAKYLITSKYTQDTKLQLEKLNFLREVALKVTWARHRIGTGLVWWACTSRPKHPSTSSKIHLGKKV